MNLYMNGNYFTKYDKLKFVGRERHHGLQIPRDNSGAVDCVDKCALDQIKKR